MSALTVGTLIAVLQLRAEQFIAANREAQTGLKATAAEAQATGAATERTDAALTQLGASATRATVGLRDTTGALISASGTTDKLTIANERLRIAQLQVIAAQERYDAVLATGTASEGEKAAAEARLSAAQTRVAVTANQAAEAMARSGAAASAAAVETEAAAVKQSESASRGLATVASTVAKTGALLGGVGLVFSIAEIAKNGNEFTHAMNSLGAASGASATQLAAARAEAIAMGKDLTIPKVTATQAAEAMEDLVKAGVSLDRAMSAVRPALLLASAANVDVADSARVTGDLLDEWGFSADQAAHVANVMASASLSAGGGLMDLFGAMKYVGPSARQLGVGFDYTTAALVELAKAGVQGSMAGTSLRNMLTRLTPQGGPATKALNDLGVSAFDATGHFKGLPTVVDQLHSAMERLSPQRFAADVSTAFGARALAGVQIFAHGGEAALQGFYDKVESNNVQAIADKMNRGVGAGFSQLGKEFSAAGLDIYNVAQGPIAAAIDWIGVELPKAGAAGKAVLAEVQAEARTLAPAWTAVSAVFSTGYTVVKTVFDFLADHTGTLKVIADAAAGMYLAFKGYAVIDAARVAIQVFANGASISLGRSVAAVETWGANWAATLAGTTVEAQAATAAVTASPGEMGTALTAEIAEQDIAAAATAQAYAEMVLASDDATAAMVANATSVAAAAQAQAEASVAAAAETAAAAEGEAAALLSAGETATLGWSEMLGPIGLVAAALTVVGLGFLSSGSKAKSAATDIDALTQAFTADNNAIADHVSKNVELTLSQKGAYDSAKQFGISQKELTDAALGNADAQKTVNDVLNMTIAQFDAARKAGTDTNDMLVNSNVAKHLESILADLGGNLTNAQKKSIDLASAQGSGAVSAATQAAQLDALKQSLGATSLATDAVSLANARGNAALLAYTTAAAAMQDALGGDKTAAQGLSDAISALNGTLSSHQARDSFLDAQAQLKQALDASSGSLDINNAKGLAADEAFNGAVAAAQQYAIAQTQVTDSIPAGIDAYNQSIDALFATAAQAGATSGQLDALKASVDSVPTLKQILTQVLGDQAAESDIGKIKAALDTLHDKTIKVTVLQNTALGALTGTGDNPAASVPPLLVPHASSTGTGHVTGPHAQGGQISLPGNGLRDTGYSPVANKEWVIKAASSNKFGVPLMSAINQGDTAGAFGMLAAKLGVALGAASSGSAGPAVDIGPVVAAIEALHDDLNGHAGTMHKDNQLSYLQNISRVSGRAY